MIVVVMGVAGAGKTLLGRLLAEHCGWAFCDADDFHPPANVEKMRAGVALDDTDRAPWLDRLNALLRENAGRGQSVVLACSALKAAYRVRLAGGGQGLRFVHLAGSRELIAKRLGERTGHYMNPALLESQLATLEAPEEAITLDVAHRPQDLLAEALARLGIDQGPAAPLRCFLALWPDEALARSCRAHGVALAHESGGRATPQARIHLTLVFLGEVDAAPLARLREGLARTPGEPFELSLDRLGCWSRNGIGWIGPSRVPPPLPALHGALEAAVRGEGLPTEDRAFLPHLTIVRRARRAVTPRGVPALPWAVSEYRLMASRLGAGGPDYWTLARYPLAR